MTSQIRYTCEEATPVQCTSEIFLLRYGFNWRGVYEPFLTENLLPAKGPSAFSVPGTRTLLSEVHEGVRRLDWCPADVSLYDHLYPFFLSRNMLVSHNLSDEIFEGLVTEEEAWIVSANKNVCLDPAEHRKRVTQSGFFERLIRPNVVQLMYLIALAEYRGRKFVEGNIQYRSPDSEHLVFVRTATEIEIRKTVCKLAVAYLPGKAVCIWPYTEPERCESLITPDIFLLQPVACEAANAG
ncbi:hypothetical protein GF391_01330 [Candidatus Uhrbacteria bacterium]|nr:hypothetical protein [Candidatus Uhrbacteria bacterium]